MAAGHGMVPMQQDIDEDDEDSVSLADDGMSSSSSSDEFESAVEDDDGTAAGDSPGTGEGAPVPAHVKRRSTDKSTSSTDSAPMGGYFDTDRQRESSPQDLSVPPTPASGISTGTMTPGGSKRPFFLRGRNSKASSLDTVEKERRAKLKKDKRRKKKKGGFNLDTDHGKDILGIVVMEIKSAEDLPKIKGGEST